MATGIQTMPGFYKPAGYVQLTSLAASTALTGVPTHCKLAIIQAEAQTVRWRDDGVAPTAGVGMILVANDLLMYTGDMSAIRFIEATAGAKLNIAYYT